MSNTTFKVDQNYFTEAKTEAFIIDLEAACQTMDVKVFTHLFLKYDLSFIEEYQDVYNLIKHIMSSWIEPGECSTLVRVAPFDSKCIFCVIGHSVKGYEWFYKHKMAKPPFNRMVFKNKIAFFLDLKKNRLVEFGVCNAYMNRKEMERLYE